MSRCKKHATDLSSTVGVCASCLRERLFLVIAAQAQKQHQLRQASLDQRHDFPRSVSPYISRRKSDASAAWQQPNGHTHHQRFYSTPQVGPTGSVTLEIREKRSKKTRLSSLFSRIFRSKPDSSDPPRGSETTSSWLSSVFSTRRKKRGATTFSLDEGSTAARRPTRQNNNKGLSPVRCSSDDEEEEEGGSSGESSESSWRHRRATTPSNASATRRRTGTAASNSLNLSSGLAFCLSPLVRASPNHRNWSSEQGVAGESHLPKPASFCKNRSRKLADFGRYNSYCGRSNR